MSHSTTWAQSAIKAIAADFKRSSDTHLIRLPLPNTPNIHLYLKDESTHPSGSLKHRLARSLILYGLCNGWIRENTVLIDASSGSTAISEAYFAQLIGLPYYAVVPEHTSVSKIERIAFYGGKCVRVPPHEIYTRSEQLAQEWIRKSGSPFGGLYLDQFTFAERATDWRGNNNIAESLFSQMSLEPYPVPTWVITGAGTGGTSATLGRYIRYHPELLQATQLCVVDPENSVLYDFYAQGDRTLTATQSSAIEGIGRPRVEPSFIPSVVNRMLRVPDAASMATLTWLDKVLGRKCGGSTGTNVYGAMQLIAAMHAQGQRGSVVTILCDSGERYLSTYHDQAWLDQHYPERHAYARNIEEFIERGEWNTSLACLEETR